MISSLEIQYFRKGHVFYSDDEQADTALVRGDLTLAGCRVRYGLPDYPAHNALVDALATAELLLA